MDGELDFCDAVDGLDDPQIGNIAKMYNMPSKCPIPPVSSNFKQNLFTIIWSKLF